MNISIHLNFIYGYILHQIGTRNKRIIPINMNVVLKYMMSFKKFKNILNFDDII